MQTNLTIIESAIANALNSTPFSERNGRALEQVVEDSIDPERFKVDPQDTKRFLGASLPVWRDGERGEIFTPRRHSAMDLVVYDGGHRAVALVEIESNLDDLKENRRVNRRNGHYDVYSIAKDASGEHFYSYKSLERMAAAAFYKAAALGTPDQSLTEPSLTTIERLERLKSDDPASHNPLGLGIFLAVGHCRQMEIDILRSRLQSLNAVLLCAHIH